MTLKYFVIPPKDAFGAEFTKRNEVNIRNPSFEERKWPIKLLHFIGGDSPIGMPLALIFAPLRQE